MNIRRPLPSEIYHSILKTQPSRKERRVRTDNLLPEKLVCFPHTEKIFDLTNNQEDMT